MHNFRLLYIYLVIFFIPSSNMDDASSALKGTDMDAKNRTLHQDHMESNVVAEWTTESDSEGENMAEKELQTWTGYAGDYSTYSRPDFWMCTHIDLKLFADFSKNTLQGYVDLDVEKQPEDGNLVLDTRDLSIDRVTLIEPGKETNLPFVLGGEAKDFRGSKLEIVLLGHANDSSRLKVRIRYATSPNASGLVWLKPSQTATKTHPYLYSQFEPIHARSMFPCQDTPAVKATYSATITVDSGLVVLMSAQRKGSDEVASGQTAFHFVQDVPIPSYLVAVAIGNLESRKIGPRSHVWAEPGIVEKAAFEFDETEKLLEAAESLAGPYVWGIYDILVLPPSFPFGGMENPCLTFATPTLLAGDRSLINVVAHEIAHSWTGNLVTNRNWEHFWINEGFTVFLERHIQGRIWGEDFRQFNSIQGWKELQNTVKRMEVDDKFTKLIPDLRNSDPDDAFSSIPYEKGYAFLVYLEQLVGGPNVFLPFLKLWIEKHQYKVADSDDFHRFFLDYFKNTIPFEQLESIDWDTWFHGKGMPPVEIKYDDRLSKPCAALCEKWKNATSYDEFKSDDVAHFSVLQQIQFLADLLLLDPLPLDAMKAMESAYGFSSSGNAEIISRWYQLCIRSQWEEEVPKALAFAVEFQRMKYSRPIFRAVYEWEKVRDQAIEMYKKYKDTMAYVTAAQLARDLHLSS